VQVRRDALGLTWRNTLVWHYGFGPHQKAKFGRDHQQLLYYVADAKRFTFNAGAVLVPSARQTKYGDQRAKPGGRVPGHVCQTPLALLERIVRVASNPGDLVLEPFAGWPGKGRCRGEENVPALRSLTLSD
jgi:site-specific DNA-methyltransferase (adenine-specific)